MSRLYRITVLRCDFVPEPDRSRHGDAHERMIAHLEAAIELAAIDAEVDWFDVYGGDLPPLDDPSDLYVTTGSATNPDSSEQWVDSLRRWMRQAVEGGHPIYGVCFGHQLLAHALGGRTRRHPVGWEVGAVGMERLFALNASDGPKTTEDNATVRLLMSHQDEVCALPENAKPWLQGEFCEIQGFVLPKLAVTVQGHPEFAAEQVRDLYERRRTLMGDELTDQALHSLTLPHNGLQLTVNVLKYLLEL